MPNLRTSVLADSLKERREAASNGTLCTHRILWKVIKKKLEKKRLEARE